MTQRQQYSDELNVVIADDEPDVRLLLRLGLRHHSINVIGEAADGHEVIEACRTLVDVDAIVLDLLMPRMNGFEVIPELQRDHPQIGIVAYTAVAGDFVRREMSRLNIALLLKSGDAGPLADALRTASSTARSART